MNVIYTDKLRDYLSKRNNPDILVSTYKPKG